MGHTVSISDLHFSGVGAGFLPGKGRVYVPFSYPGESIEITLGEQIRDGHWQAERAAPPVGHCAVAGRCGGCIWPAAPYDSQLTWKKELLLRELRSLPEIVSIPVTLHGSDLVTGMRSRIHLHASLFRGQFEFGFYARGSMQLVPVDDCPMAEQPIRDIVAQLATLRGVGFPGAAFGFGIELIHLPEEGGRILMLLYSSPAHREILGSLVSRFSEISPRLIVRIAFAGDAPLLKWERYRGMVLYTKPGCFQQVNRLQGLRIRALIGDKIAAERPQVLFDLYSGSGNYSLPFHADVSRICGCDDNAIGIEVAAANTSLNGIANAGYVCGDAGEILRDRVSHGWPEYADFVIADPARQGMSEVVHTQLRTLKIRTLVYIAHHRATFVRDAKRLLAAGFAPETLHLVDFFPFTPQLNIVSFWRGI